MVMNFQVPWNIGNFWSGYAILISQELSSMELVHPYAAYNKFAK
jgi:hypothetical protein